MRVSVRCLAVLAIALLIPALAAAQTELGKISGTVTDQSGAVLPGVTVNLKSVGRASTRSTVTNAQGEYVFASLVPGPYEVTAELSGFSTKQTKTTVPVGATVAVNVQMTVGAQTEVITVVGETAAAINTSTQDISTTISETQIRELPTITRNPYDLVQLSGQATGDNESNRGTGYSINGARSASTNVLLDGSANNDEFVAAVGQAVPLDSVQEFSVITSNFSAQYGRATGGIVNVATKSGTNQFRGTAYDFYRSDGLSTNTFNNKANGIEQGQFSRHQVGFSLGGPLVKDKVHFFTSGEYIRVRSSDTQISWVPTPEFIAASGAATQAFFNAYGGGATINGATLTRGQVSGILGTAAGPFNSLPADLPVFGQVRKSLPHDAGGGDPQDNYQLVARMDFSLSSSTQAYVRYAYQKLDAQPGTNSSSPYNGYDTAYLNHNNNILGSLTHVFSSTFTSQTKVVWNRLLSDQPLNGPAQPTLYMNPTTPVRLQGYRIAFPGYLPWNPGSAIPFGGPQSLLQLYQDFNVVKGKHDIRFGGSYTHIADDRTFGAYEGAVEDLNTSQTAIPSLDNFVTGNLKRFQVAIDPAGYPGGTYTTPVGVPSFLSNNTYNEFAVYGQDTWSVSDRVKVNLGLRYEYYGPQTKSSPKYDSNFYYSDPSCSVNTSSPTQLIDCIRGGQVLPTNESPIGSLWKADWNNFAPRVGVAWDVNGDGKTSVRAGYGMAYERNFGNVTYNVLFNPPEYLVASIDAPTDVKSMPVFSDNQGPFGGIAGVTKTIPAGSLRHVDQNIVTAYSHFYSVSLQREILPNTTASIEYTGSTGRNLYDLADPNKRGAALVYEGIGTANQRPITQYAAFNTRGNRGRSQYNGVTLGIDTHKLGSTGLQFTAKYTYSVSKDNLSSTFSDSGNDFNLGYLDAFDPMLDYGYSGYDVRHRVIFAGIWELPIARNATGATKTFLGGWQLNWILTARSGYPFTLFDCTNGLGYCMRAEDPVGISRSATSGSGTGNPNEFSLLDLTPLAASAGGYVNPITGNSDFGPYPADMTKRNDFRGPGYWNADLSLSKRFRFGDHYALQIRAEAYNVFNHANMYAVTGNADLSSFTEITGFKGYTGCTSGCGVQGDGQRRIQLAAKFEF
ncbi:MAG TPA: TonB-dependent receptor [Vicinamibacteria bacterium]|nr:TonB-dependent receptor [Vicinamibacteria bacterium]